MVAAATPEKNLTSSRRGRERAIHASESLVAAATDNGSVIVSFSLAQNPGNLVMLRDAIAAASPKGAKLEEDAPKLLASALEKVGEQFLQVAFSTEFDKLISEYRVMLREHLAKADDAPLRAALNRARIQERILASTQMADQAEACELLGLSGSNPSATMKRKEEKNEVLRFTVDGRAVYPLLQFDVDNRRIYPALNEIIARKPDDWSDFRLLHWLTREHLDFDDAPAAALGSEPEAVIAAFERAIEPEVHG